MKNEVKPYARQNTKIELKLRKSKEDHLELQKIQNENILSR